MEWSGDKTAALSIALAGFASFGLGPFVLMPWQVTFVAYWLTALGCLAFFMCYIWNPNLEDYFVKSRAPNDPNRPLKDFSPIEAYLAGRRAGKNSSATDSPPAVDQFKRAKDAAKNAKQSMEQKAQAQATGVVVHKPPFFFNGWELDKPLCPSCWQSAPQAKVYLIHNELNPESWACPAKGCGFRHFPNGSVHVVERGY